MRLSGKQYQQLTEALLDAFPTQAGLRQMVRFRLDKNLDRIAIGSSLQNIVFDLIAASEAEGWTMKLIAAARESNSGNSTLFAVAQQLELAPTVPSYPQLVRSKLERVIKSSNSFLDINEWRTRLGKIEFQVCRIEVKLFSGMIYGTGFLLGPNVVITNYHVMEPVIEDKGAKPDDVILRFDYKRLEDGSTINNGTIYHLAIKNWLIDKSPPSLVDMIAEPKSQLPQPNELDYALLRVAESPGHDRIGDKPEPEAPPRKWIEIPTSSYDFQPNTALFIVQHPQGDPIKLVLDTEAILRLNSNSTRVTYRTNTLPGSSGSPCFNSNWELVALHHSGDPNFNPVYNEGIPFTAILALLEQRGLRNELGEQEL
jgi:Effector-associated domain 1/Trypsin-like peptidase domain